MQSLSIVSRTLSNHYYNEVVQEGIAEVQKGNNLSGVVASHPDVFPIVVSQVLEVGEETGKTEEVLARLASSY